jgi:hypothetical protein
VGCIVYRKEATEEGLKKQGKEVIQWNKLLSFPQNSRA